VQDIQTIWFEIRSFKGYSHELMSGVGFSSLAELVTAFEAESGYKPVGNYR
jgi:hypothetical protein